MNKKKCVPDGLYYNGQINNYYYITNLKNGGIKVKTFYFNKYKQVYLVKGIQTIKSGEVFLIGVF